MVPIGERMNCLLCTVSIIAPLLLIRLCQKMRWREFIFGVCSDLFLAAQVLSLCGLIGIGYPALVPYVFGFLLWVLPVVSLADRMLEKNTGIRLRLNLLSHLRSAGDFWESAVSMGFYRWSAATLGWLLAAFYLSFILDQKAIFYPGLGLYAVSGALLVIMEKWLSALSIYSAHNLFVLEEQEMIFRIFKKQENQSHADPKTFLPTEERSFFIDPNYPLLRITEDFQGEEHFSLKLEKEEKPHVIFLCLESFRACGIPCLDSFRPVRGLAPCFERLAGEGILWRNFYSASTRSCKALLATLYGVHPQVEDDIFTRDPSFSLRGLPDILKEQGYYNAYFHNGDIDFDRQGDFLLHHGFDTVQGKMELHTAFEGKIERSAWGIHDEYLMRHAADFLSAKDREGTPCFLYLFTVSNHYPWRLPSGVASKTFMTAEGPSEAPFFQTMHYADHWLGWFVDRLRSEGLLKKSLVFIFGDHGQPLDEHPEKAQQREGIYEEGVRVPLLLLGKGISPAAIDEVASHIDLLPSLIDMMNIKSLHHGVGRSLKRRKENSEAHFFSPFYPKVLGCRTQQWKLIHNPVSGEDELFHLESDPGEKVNVANEHGEMAAKLRAHAIEQRSLFEELYKEKRFFPSHNLQEQAEIDLRGRADLEDDDLIAIFRELYPSALLLDGCRRISNRALAKIAPHCSGLRSLSLKDCTGITEEGLIALARHAPPLKTLDLSGCLTIDFAAMEEFWKKVPYLQKLLLRSQPFLSDQAIEALMRSLDRLERLDVPQSSSLTDASLAAVAAKSSCLTFFSFHALNMSEAGVQNVLANARQLRGFSVEGGDALTDKAFSGDFANLVTATFLDCPHLEGRFLAAWQRSLLDAIHFAAVPALCDEAVANCAIDALQYIYLSGCPRLTDRGVLSLAGIPAKEIHLIDCPGITRKAVHELRKTTRQVFWS